MITYLKERESSIEIYIDYEYVGYIEKEKPDQIKIIKLVLTKENLEYLVSILPWKKEN